MQRNGLSTRERNQPQRSAVLKHRRGSVLLEFILAFPIILMLSLAIIEFGFYTLLQQTITAAAIEGSRKAAEVGSTTDAVGDLIQDFVAINSLTLNTTPAAPNNGDVFVSIEDGTDVLTTTMGNSSIPCSPVGPDPSDGSSPPPPAEIKVTICVNLTDANGTFPIPNLLYLFGFSLSGKQLEISAMTVLE